MFRNKEIHRRPFRVVSCFKIESFGQLCLLHFCLKWLSSFEKLRLHQNSKIMKWTCVGIITSSVILMSNVLLLLYIITMFFYPPLDKYCLFKLEYKEVSCVANSIWSRVKLISCYSMLTSSIILHSTKVTMQTAKL